MEWRSGGGKMGCKWGLAAINAPSLLVIIEAAAIRSDRGCAGPEAGVPVQKKGLLGSLQKKYFSTLPQTRFFCSF